MPYVNDMQTLADVVSPVDAAVQMGIQNQQANQKEQMANEVYKQQMPALEAEPGLKNLFTQAQTSVDNANAQGTTLGNIEKAGTLGSTINSTNAGNQLKLTQDQVDKINALGQMAGQVAGFMDQVPPAARPAAMQEFLQSKGIDPQQLGPLASGDPDMLRHVATQLTQMSPNYQIELMKENMNTARSMGVAQTTSDARIQAAEMQANARRQVAEIQRQAKLQSQTFEQAAVAAEKAGDHAGAQKYYQAAQNIRQMAAQTTQTLVGVQQPNPGFMTQPSEAPTPQQPPSAAPSGDGTPSPADVEAEMKRRGLIK